MAILGPYLRSDQFENGGKSFAAKFFRMYIDKK